MSITAAQLDAIIESGKAGILDRNLATAILGGTVEQTDRRVRTAAPKAPRTRKAAPKAATIEKPARKAEPKADSKQRKTTTGRMMSAEPSTITKGQIDRIYAQFETQSDFVEDFKLWHGWARKGEARPKTMRHMSMADASDFYSWLTA